MPGSSSRTRSQVGASGVHFSKVVDRLGIADQLKSKTSKGEAEIGVPQTSEIVPIAGAEVLGPLPGEFASTTVWTAGIGTTTKVPEAALYPIPHWTGCQTTVECQRLSTRIANTSPKD